MAQNGQSFAVPGVVDAVGNASRSVTPSGVTVQQYEVGFARGDVGFMISAVSANGTLGEHDAISIAAAQAALAPGSPSSADSQSGQPWQWKAGRISAMALIVLLVIGVVLIFVRRSQRSHKVPAEAMARRAPVLAPAGLPALQSLGASPPQPTRQLSVGWHRTGHNMNEQAYWDGQAWTVRKVWTGASWSEVPIDAAR